MKIGMPELLVVFIVALVVIGPDKLPMYAKKFGQALAQFRKYSEEATKDIRENIVSPLEEAQRPLREALEPVTELEKSVRGNVNDIKKSLNGIGKPETSNPKRESTAEGPSDTVHSATDGPISSSRIGEDVPEYAAQPENGTRINSAENAEPSAVSGPALTSEKDVQSILSS